MTPPVSARSGLLHPACVTMAWERSLLEMARARKRSRHVLSTAEGVRR